MLLLQTGTTLTTDNLWVTIVTVLFALSLISERIANLIKLNTDHLGDKRYNLKGEKRREKNIMLVAVACGIVTSTVAGADFFTLIDRGKLVSTLDVFGSADVLTISKVSLGFILSGFFVSMGSKFWHDVLDIVLQFSNLRKYKVDTTMREAKMQIDLVNENTRVQLVNKTENIVPRLKQIAGYSGYDVLVNDQEVEVQLKFKGKKPEGADKKWIDDYYGTDNVIFQTLDTEAGLHGN
jgi:hypothetical protein